MDVGRCVFLGGCGSLPCDFGDVGGFECFGGVDSAARWGKEAVRLRAPSKFRRFYRISGISVSWVLGVWQGLFGWICEMQRPTEACRSGKGLEGLIT